jgi:cyclopropane-fatty-acyl-phospholipid synthase
MSRSRLALLPSPWDFLGTGRVSKEQDGSMGSVFKRSEFSWEKYFSDKKTGGHRFSTEEFLAKEANEKLFHLSGGKTLLDFGCGAGELLIYFVPKYEKVVGADFSKSMLFEAEKKLLQHKYENADLILADDKTVWDKLSLQFDRITATEVVQYFTPEQLEDFIRNASRYLNVDGKIVFFDIIDPRLYYLWKVGWFSQNFISWNILARAYSGFVRRTLAFLRNQPGDIVGNSYNPSLIEKIANGNGFQMEYVKSMYYEYRYHVILSKNA